MILSYPYICYIWALTLLLDGWKSQRYPHLGCHLGVWKGLTDNGLPRQKMIYLSIQFVWPPADFLGLAGAKTTGIPFYGRFVNNTDRGTDRQDIFGVSDVEGLR